MDLFLSGYLKGKVYSPKLATADELGEENVSHFQMKLFETELNPFI